jgi:hypothetical protein
LSGARLGNLAEKGRYDIPIDFDYTEWQHLAVSLQMAGCYRFP